MRSAWHDEPNDAMGTTDAQMTMLTNPLGSRKFSPTLRTENAPSAKESASSPTVVEGRQVGNLGGGWRLTAAECRHAGN